MLRLRGGSALSPFRLEKLAAALKITAPQVSHIYAEYWYFCAVTRDLRENEIAVLRRLLKCSPEKISTTEVEERQTRIVPRRIVLLVVPRPGTISPWSTKATDIARHCGLEAVERLERGVAFYIQHSRSGMRANFPPMPEFAASR